MSRKGFKLIMNDDFDNSALRLYISKEQKPWCPEWNGPIRVSNLQTGVFSGELGSDKGQHHFCEGLRVREYQPKEIRFAFQYGRIEFKGKCHIQKNNVAALWLIGLEESEEESAEICLFELKGWNVKTDKSVIGYGVHPFKDSRIKDCFYEDEFEINVSEWNEYALEWRPEGIDFYINGLHVRNVKESPDYSMQLMLNLYDLENIDDEKANFEIDYIRVYVLDKL